MADISSVLFISCSSTHPDDLIKLFLNVPELPQKIKVDDGVHGFSWYIDNKYYTAEVNLCVLQNKNIVSRHFAESVEAVILYFDSSAKDALERVESWLPFVKEYSPEVKILLCENVPDERKDSTGCTKKNVQEWCIGNGFELVELEPIVEEIHENDLEDDFQETTGMKRVIQALNAHLWPNLVMKSSCHPMVPKPMDAEIGFEALKEKLGIEESFGELLENEDDFSQLFAQLSTMKERVSTLSGSDRKDAAEVVVKAFWKALGGNENEFLDM